MKQGDATSLKVAFLHPDLGIGGAERLVVDAALGLQRLGHSVDIYTSYHDPAHAFEETIDGTLRVKHVKSPFPRALWGMFHILFAHLRQIHLTAILLLGRTKYDVFFVDQLSTCIPILRLFSRKRVVFYCHFPDKLLANGEFIADKGGMKQSSFLKRIYRWPMDFLEEKTTACADILLANSEFTADVFGTFFSIDRRPRVVYPGINLSAYDTRENEHTNSNSDVTAIQSTRPTLLSLNRFEKKKNALLAIQAVALLKDVNIRLVLAGGFDSRLHDNVETLQSLVDRCASQSLTFWISTPSTTGAAKASHAFDYPKSTATSLPAAQVVFLLNFTTAQRTALLNSPSTLVLLYTPANEHFGIGPVEAMACGVPVLACDSGGPTESIVDSPAASRTGWLRKPVAEEWSQVLREEIIEMSLSERASMKVRSKDRVRSKFAMEAMSKGIEGALHDAISLGAVKTPSWLLMSFISLLVLFATLLCI